MRTMWAGIVAVGLLSSCQQVQGWLGEKAGADSTQTITTSDAHAAKLVRDASISRENAYSDLFVDSSALEAYLGKEKIDGEKATRMRAFYTVRNNQFAWFTSAGPTEQARSLWSLCESRADELRQKPSERLQERMNSLLTHDSSGMAAARPAKPVARSISVAEARTGRIASEEAATRADSTAAQDYKKTDSSMIETEFALTAQFVSLAQESKSGLNSNNFYWMVPRKKVDALTLADSLLHQDTDSALWQGNTQYAALRTALAPYYEAARNGGWPALAAVSGLRKGARAPGVVQLKKRLAASGDYGTADTSQLYSDTLLMAVRAVQERFGLKPTGLPSDSLVRALNVPAEERLQQLLVNMNRALWLPSQTDSTRILVNIPAQELVAYSDSGAVLRMPVIVGREGTGTMAINDRISTVVFHPYWNVPKSVVQSKILPAMKADPNYLEKNHMEVLDQNDSLPQVRQLPGPDNALGQVKFLFPNSFDIYLHDTPHKELFAQRNRALSNGCIRVARPDSLAAFVLRGQSGWTAEKITAAMSGNGKEQSVKVQRPVPVSITYYTAWTGSDGKLHFRPDLYGYDQKTAERMFTSRS